MLLKKKKYLTPLLLSSLLTLLACSTDNSTQNPVDNEPEPTGFEGIVDFVQTYGGSNEDDAVGVVQSIDGNYVILGSTQSNDGDIVDKTSTDSDYWVLKVTPEGDIVWSKTYGGSSDERATSISATSDGGFIISGHSRSSDGDVSGNEGFHDYWILKIDAFGNIQWDRNFGFAGSDQAFKVFETRDGGYFATGFLDVSASNGQGNDGRNGGYLHGVGEYWAIKMDASGNRIWRRFFGGTNNDRSYDALQTADDGFLLVGASESDDFDITDSKGSYDFWAVRLSDAGDLLWTKSFGGSQIDIGYAVSSTADGNYLMVGDARSDDMDVTNPLGNADAWAVKFDDTGAMMWQKSFGGSDFESARSAYRLSDGNYLISGSTRSSNGDVANNNGQNDAWVVIMDDTGSIIFENTSGGSDLDFANDAIQTNDQKVLVVGNTESNDLDIALNRGNKDFLLIKIK